MPRRHHVPAALGRTLAALLAAALLLGQAAAAESRYPPKEHLRVDYAQMDDAGFDAGALEGALAALEALCASPAIRRERPETRRMAEELYRAAMDQLDRLETARYLADIRADGDQGDPALADRSLELSEQVDRAYDRCCLALRGLVGTPYQDILEADAGPEGVAMLADYRETPEEAFALRREEDRLVRDYEQAMASPAEVTVDGQVWTEEALDRADWLDDGAYWAVYDLLAEARGRRAGEIFLELVRVRTEIAREAGYDNYADYAHRELYQRDYTAADIQTVCRAAKTRLAPLSQRLWDTVEDRDLRALDLRSRGSGEEILDAVQPYLGDIDPELAETFAFLREFHLYDIEAREGKAPTGYTVPLPAYGTAFLFDSPYGGYLDYSTVIHEFGHFNETFHTARRELWSPFHIDVGEIHSQGLEALYLAYAEDLFGEEAGRTFYRAVLANLVDAVLEGCLYDEFQTAVYRDPDMDVEDLGRLFRDLSGEYGYAYGAGEAVDWTWTEVDHTFSSPMYYISYATSALSALDLWRLSLRDRDRAVETYMDLTVLGMSRPYRAAVAEVGLTDIFRPGAVEDLAETLETELDRDFRPGPDPVRAAVAGCAAAAVLAAVAVPLSLRRRAAACAAP